MPYRLSNGIGQTISTDRMTDATIRAQKQRGDLALKEAQARITPGTMTAQQAKIMAQIEKLRGKHMREREMWRRKSDSYREKVGKLLTKLAATKAVPVKPVRAKRKARKVRAIPVGKKAMLARMKAGRIFRR